VRGIDNLDGKRMTTRDKEAPDVEETDLDRGEAQNVPVSEFEAVTAERNQYLDQLQRSLAEFANYRKRVEQERVLARKIATRDLLLSLVRIDDDFKRALDAIPAEDADASWLQGVRLIERNLNGLLEREGVTPVEALGQPFDPSKHEAVAVDPGSTGSVVNAVFQTGYWHGDQLLRPAMVKVGDPISADEEAGKEASKQDTSTSEP
jgi:molecular chaperone GrpE